MFANGGVIGVPPPGLTKVARGSYLGGMRAVGLKTLKNKLSEYVRLAAGGETVLVTDRDRVVAEIVPPRPGRSSCWPTRCSPRRCVRAGLRRLSAPPRVRRPVNPS